MSQSLAQIYVHIIFSTKNRKYETFYWQDGYAAFSINPSEVEVVVNYISHQKEHHHQVSFQNECRSLFKEYNVEYDERYVWE